VRSVGASASTATGTWDNGRLPSFGGYGHSARAPTLAKMSQAFRSLVLRAKAVAAAQPADRRRTGAGISGVMYGVSWPARGSW